jgi:hypothetical protein
MNLSRETQLRGRGSWKSPTRTSNLKLSGYTHGARLSYISEVSTATAGRLPPGSRPCDEAWLTSPTHGFTERGRGATTGTSCMNIQELSLGRCWLWCRKQPCLARGSWTDSEWPNYGMGCWIIYQDHFKNYIKSHVINFNNIHCGTQYPHDSI